MENKSQFDKQIIFIIGMPRSGTSLLHYLISRTFKIPLYYEPQFLREFKKFILKSKGSESKFAVYKFIDLYCKKSKYKRKDILHFLPELSFSGAFYAIMKHRNLIHNGKNLFGAKLPYMDIKTLNKIFKNLKVIHIIRDGRDCALSILSQYWGSTNFYVAACQWKSYILKNRKDAEKLLKNNYIELKYEKLVEDPIKELKRLQGFLGVGEMDLDILKNLVRYEIINKKAVFKWKKDMRKKDIALFQTVAGQALKKLEYEIYPVDNIKISTIRRFIYLLWNFICREYKTRFRKPAENKFSYIREIESKLSMKR